MPIYQGNSEELRILELIDDHNHSVELCSVDNAESPLITASTATAWSYGAFVELIGTASTDEPFDLHFLNSGAATEVTTYQIQLYKGLAGNEEVISTVRFARLSNQTGASSHPLMTPILPAGTRISGRCSAGVAGASVKVSLQYHKY